MNCSEFDAIAPDLSRPGAVSQETRAAALAHAESCGRCAAMLTETESLELALRELAASRADLRAPARLGDTLLCEFRRRKKAPALRSVRMQSAAIAVAAAVLLALGISFRHDFLKHSITESTSNPAVRLPQAKSPIAAPAGNQAVQSPAERAAGPIATASSTNAGKTSDAESEQAFVALPYADDLENLEGGAVVRVNLSRAALASFGVPVSDLGEAEQIPADVVVSADGIPEAVRFVSQALPGENISEK